MTTAEARAEKKSKRKKMLTIMGQDSGWIGCPNLEAMVQEVAKDLFSGPSDKYIEIQLPDGTTHYTRTAKEASEFMECSESAVGRSIREGKPVAKGRLKGVVFRRIEKGNKNG